MSSRNRKFTDRVSYVVLWLALIGGIIALIFSIVNYLAHGNNDYNKEPITYTVKFLVFAIFVFGYRKLFLKKNN